MKIFWGQVNKQHFKENFWIWGPYKKRWHNNLPSAQLFLSLKLLHPTTHTRQRACQSFAHTHTMQFIDGGHWSAHCQQMRALCRTIILFFSYISINLLHRLYTVYSNKNPVLSSWSRWSGNYLRPGAEAEIIFLIQQICTAISLENARMKKNLHWDIFLMVLLL